jgi:hypothetical protein
VTAYKKGFYNLNDLCMGTTHTFYSAIVLKRSRTVFPTGVATVFSPARGRLTCYFPLVASGNASAINPTGPF